MTRTNSAVDFDGKLRYVKIYLADILEGMEELSWEERGFYVTALFKMYARMGGIPSCDEEGARVMRCNPRTFRRFRSRLVEAGKFQDRSGLLINVRVERMIEDYCREVRNRTEAALKREEEKRRAAEEAARARGVEGGLDGVETGDTKHHSGRIQVEFRSNSPRIQVENSANGDEKPNEINGCTATAVPQGVPQPYKLETRIEEGSKNNPPAPLAGGGELPLAQPDTQPESPKPRAAKTRQANAEAKADIDRVLAAYNAAADEFGFSACRVVTEARGRRIRKRLADIGGPEPFLEALGAIRFDPFLMGKVPGRDGQAFRLDIDRLLSTESGLGDVLARLLERARAADAARAPRYWWQDPDKLRQVDGEGWKALIAKWAGNIWPVDKLGPPPGDPRCVVPREIVRELRLERIYTDGGIRIARMGEGR